MQKLLDEPVVILSEEGEEEFVVVPKSQYRKPVSPVTSFLALIAVGVLFLLAIPVICRILKKLFL